MERLTWEEIQKKYPHQWVGLEDVKLTDGDGVGVESAVVKYTDKTMSELTHMALNGETFSIYTTPEDNYPFRIEVTWG